MIAHLMFVLGTRPEAIKLAPLIKRAQGDRRFKVTVCSTGQHREMLQQIFEAFKITPQFDFQLMRPGQTLADVTAAILKRLPTLLGTIRPDWVVVQGDTTTVMAASLCAFFERIPLAHVEAGLRTGNMQSPFPEEFNRRAAALMARLHFAPTLESAENLLAERIPARDILVTGNTGIDALLHMREQIESGVDGLCLSNAFQFLDSRKKLVLVTVHRRESFGAPMESILKALVELSRRDDVEFILPLHLNPQVRRAAEQTLGGTAKWVGESEDTGRPCIWLCEPQGYASFVYLMNRAHLILTDSGGVQEEAPSLGKPVLVLRETTERPEAIKAGTSKLIGSSQTRIVNEATELLDQPEAYQKMARAHNPFGDGHASERILDHIFLETFKGGLESQQPVNSEPLRSVACALPIGS